MISLTATTYDSRRLDLSEVFQTAEVETQRFDAPGRMTFNTLEASGIAVACMTAQYFQVPVLFAKKSKYTSYNI